MGNSSSKAMIKQLKEQQDVLIKQHADMAERLLRQQDDHKKQQEAFLEQMAKIMFLMINSKTDENVINEENKDIEIEGTIYRIEQFVNRGGFGQIYKAKARNSDRMIAIKFLPNTTLIQDQIQTEIHFLQATQKILLKNHPVIEYFGCKTTDDGIYIALELAVCDLYNFWIQKVARASAEQKFIFGAIVIMYVLRALIFLEKISIIHGDIKPQNLVIVEMDNYFCIKLIDFGTVEKLDTARSVITVGADKAHTRFFASPEFLKRDANNLVSRRLHKKSDAWAAGVMFYYLMCDGLPWADPYEYENFVNDPNSKDIVVPEEGGYKPIIELLLKKNPDQRSSAEETLIKMKKHSVLGAIVEALEEKFYPVDDVCHLKISENVRQELNKRKPQRLAVRGQAAGGAQKPASNNQTQARRPCKYGSSCFNKDPDHRQQFSHSSDGTHGSTPAYGADRSPCQYGSSCYNTDPDHLEEFSHPSKEEARGYPPANTKKPFCRYGSTCTNKDPDHLQEFSHPSKEEARDYPPASAKKPFCRYGATCHNNDSDHREQFSHPADAAHGHTPSHAKKTEKPRCKYGASCFNKDPEHRQGFSHSTDAAHGNSPAHGKKVPCRYGSSCYNKDPDHRQQYQHN